MTLSISRQHADKLIEYYIIYYFLKIYKISMKYWVPPNCDTSDTMKSW